MKYTGVRVEDAFATGTNLDKGIIQGIGLMGKTYIDQKLFQMNPNEANLNIVEPVVKVGKAGFKAGVSFSKGASTFNDINKAPLNGNYLTLPKGLAVIADGRDAFPNSIHGDGHYTFYPTKQMTVIDFNNLFKTLPWKSVGKK